MFRSKPKTLDPDLLVAAAHELGHAATARHYRVGLIHIRLDPYTHQGGTLFDLPEDDMLWTDTQWRCWLISCFAGYEAEVMWADQHGGVASKRACRADFRNFRNYRRHAGLSKNAARSAARTIVRAGWARIERLAPRLATTGRLASW